MNILNFVPRIFNICYYHYHDLIEWDLLTLDGYNPKQTTYFVNKNTKHNYQDHASKIQEYVVDEDWEEKENVKESDLIDFDIKG